jgi:hypothetical protein
MYNPVPWKDCPETHNQVSLSPGQARNLKFIEYEEGSVVTSSYFSQSIL